MEASERVLELSLVILKAQKEIQEILESIGKSARESREAVVEAITGQPRRKRGRPPKIALPSFPTAPDLPDDGMASIKTYRCLDCEKEMSSRQEYLDVTCSRCKGNHIFQTNKMPQRV